MAELTIEQAVDVLNERKWRGWVDWAYRFVSQTRIKVCPTRSEHFGDGLDREDAIAIAQGLLDAERVKELEAAVKRTGDRVECVGCKALISPSAVYPASRDPESAPVCWGCGPGRSENERLRGERDEMKRVLDLLVSDHDQGLSFDIVWARARRLRGAKEKQGQQAVERHPEENCPSLECPEHGTKEPKEKV